MFQVQNSFGSWTEDEDAHTTATSTIPAPHNASSNSSYPFRSGRAVRGPHAFDPGWIDPEPEEASPSSSADLISPCEWELRTVRRVWGPREKKHGRVDGGRHWRCVSRLEPVLDVGEKSTQEFTYELIEAQRDIPRGEGKMRGRKGTMENEARQDDKLVSGWSKKARDEFTRKGREIK